MKNFNITLGLAAAALVMLVPEVAMAKNMGDAADGLSGQFDSIKGAIIGAGFMLGAALAVGGVYMIYKDSKQPGQDHFKKGVVGLVAGALLLSLPALIKTTQETVDLDTTDVITQSVN